MQTFGPTVVFAKLGSWQKSELEIGVGKNRKCTVASVASTMMHNSNFEYFSAGGDARLPPLMLMHEDEEAGGGLPDVAGTGDVNLPWDALFHTVDNSVEEQDLFNLYNAGSALVEDSVYHRPYPASSHTTPSPLPPPHDYGEEVRMMPLKRNAIRSNRRKEPRAVSSDCFPWISKYTAKGVSAEEAVRLCPPSMWAKASRAWDAARRSFGDSTDFGTQRSARGGVFMHMLVLILGTDRIHRWRSEEAAARGRELESPQAVCTRCGTQWTVLVRECERAFGAHANILTMAAGLEGGDRGVGADHMLCHMCHQHFFRTFLKSMDAAFPNVKLSSDPSIPAMWRGPRHIAGVLDMYENAGDMAIAWLRTFAETFAKRCDDRTLALEKAKNVQPRKGQPGRRKGRDPQPTKEVVVLRKRKRGNNKGRPPREIASTSPPPVTFEFEHRPSEAPPRAGDDDGGDFGDDCPEWLLPDIVRLVRDVTGALQLLQEPACLETDVLTAGVYDFSLIMRLRVAASRITSAMTIANKSKWGDELQEFEEMDLAPPPTFDDTFWDNIITGTLGSILRVDMATLQAEGCFGMPTTTKRARRIMTALNKMSQLRVLGLMCELVDCEMTNRSLMASC